MGREKGVGQFTALYSTLSPTQLSVGGQYGDRAAILVGNSSGLPERTQWISEHSCLS